MKKTTTLLLISLTLPALCIKTAMAQQVNVFKAVEKSTTASDKAQQAAVNAEIQASQNTGSSAKTYRKEASNVNYYLQNELNTRKEDLETPGKQDPRAQRRQDRRQTNRQDRHRTIIKAVHPSAK
jgi:hypothetical protein